MEGNSWRPVQGDSAAPPDGGSADWRSQLQAEARQRIVNKIMDTLKRHLPISVPEGLNELQKIAVRFEEKIYSAASNQSDYLRKISLKMLSMENKSQHPAPVPNTATNQNSPDPASLGMPSQVNNHGQLFSISVSQASLRQQTQILPSALSSITSGVSPPSNLQNMAGMLQNAANNSLGQVAVSDIYTNSQRMPGRQQPQQLISQQHPQSQNQIHYQPQFQHQFMNRPQQQQSLLQSNQLQSSQQSLMQMSSNLQSNQSGIQQIQSGGIQSAVQAGLQQNQLSSVQQPAQPLLPQHPQSVARQPQQQQQIQPSMLQQTPPLQQQQPTPAPQHSTLSMQPHLIGNQPNVSNVSNVPQRQLLGQQTNIPEMQQKPQRMPVQQNNLLNMQPPQHLLNQQPISLHQQQQLGSQSNIQGLPQQQQQQQIIGSLPNVSTMPSHQRPMHMLQQSKSTVQQQQQQNQQAPLGMLQPQSQQSQHQSSQQQLISQFQSQPAPSQQEMVQNSLQREMQQRIQASGGLLSQNAIEQPKQFVQTQMGVPEVSSSATLDSTAQSGHVGAVDLQEEIYQKVKSMKDRYYAELSEFYQKIALKLQQLQHDAIMPSVKATEHFDKMKNFKSMLERTLQMLQLTKNNIHPNLKDKLPMYEKQIVNILASQKKKVNPSQPPGQQQLPHPSGHSHSVPQQQPSQVPQLQQQDNYTNQQMNLQTSTSSIQPAPVPSMQHSSGPLSGHFGVPAPQQNITNALPSGSTIDAVQGNSFTSLQQGPIASMQIQQGGLGSGQSSINIPQQGNSSVISHGSMNSLQNNATSKQQATAIQQHFKQQQQDQQQQQHHLMSNQLKQQFQRHNVNQQMFQQPQKQQLLQAQQPLQQQQQQQQKQQASQMQAQQMPQLHQTNEVNDVKLRPGIKAGLYQQHYAGQRHNYYHQLKPGAAFPISSPQNFQASSPQISHNSPQIDQHLLSSQIKSGTPLQSASSPFVPSPSPSVAPSPIPGESEKQLSGTTSLLNAGHTGQQSAIAPSQPQSLAVATPGISASPLLAEFTSPDGNQTNLPNLVVSKSSTTERPLEHLIKVIQSSTPKALSSAVSDIGSVVSMIDRIAGSAPGNGSRAAVGEDLVAMTKCRLQARSFMSQDGSATTKKIKRDTSAMPLNNVTSAGSVNDSFKQSYGIDTSELESTATSRVKQQKVEINHALLEEIREINQRLIVTAVYISEEDADSISTASEGEGTIVKCFFTAVALCPSLKSQFASEHMSPILPLRLLVPANYPKCSPVLLDKLPDEQSRESDDLSVKARSRFIISLRGLSQPMSLGEMARTWDACAQKVIIEYAQQTGGGTFSSRYGAWENCVGA